MIIAVTDPSMVMLIGPSGSGKSTFARRHFRTTEVLSSDFCRALVCDNDSDQSATDDAFELLHMILAKRLRRRRTTVIDATNVQQFARESLILAAQQYNVELIAIVFALPEEVCRMRNQQRAYRQVPGDVILKQIAELTGSIAQLNDEGFHAIHRIQTVDEAESLILVRQPAHS